MCEIIQIENFYIHLSYAHLSILLGKAVDKNCINHVLMSQTFAVVIPFLFNSKSVQSYPACSWVYQLICVDIVRYCAWFRFETFYCGIRVLVKFRKLGEVYKTRRYAFFFLKKEKRIILIIVCYPKDLRLPTHFVGF